MIPRRFYILRPYLASFIHSRFPRPPVSDIIEWIFRPGKEKRASKFMRSVKDLHGMKEVYFEGYDKPFYYPGGSNWINFCQTVDECLNVRNWHHFITPETRINEKDIVVDCGAAEGLFSFIAAFSAKSVFAIEPIPSWHAALERTFLNVNNVTVLKCGVGHKPAELRMTNDEMCSRVSKDGEVAVRIDTLDSILGDKPITFLKADIEGFEFHMLLGAENTIRKNRPTIALTVYHEGNDFIEMRNYLSDLHSDYKFKTRGIAENGNPVLFLAY